MNLNYYIRITFWRTAASMTGFAVQHQKTLQKMLQLAPIAAAGVVAYFLGRMLGELLMWGLTL